MGTAAPRPSIANGDSESDEEHVPGYAAAICVASLLSLLPAKTQSGWRDSNPRPLRPERSALPSCATPRVKPRQRIAPRGQPAKEDCLGNHGARQQQSATAAQITSVPVG